ncbi:Glycosyltransferase involved in cell wall bisynthesis [Thermocrinis minervae]|uniref:Glycosyltransferase involved in cell wall bisynthesis n=2 Tax=Thermocrinis minervae TaxID=381751 RepID=A0A1M6SA95_9AQUI|nr:Glycosyltransferase involved in cell wall bisynthesis [Thermocrinis minervae]
MIIMSDKNKSIVLSSNTSFSLYNFRLGLMKALQERGFRVMAVAPEDEFSQKLEALGFDFSPIRNLDRKGKNPIKDLRLLFEYVSIYRRLRPHLVINFTIKPNIYSSVACGLLGIKSISVVTGLGYVYIQKRVLQTLVNLLYKVAFSFNQKVVFLNEEDMENFLSIGLVKKQKAILIKSEGINTEYFYPMEVKKTNQKPIFLMISRLLWDKGVREFVEAGRILREKGISAELWLLGPFDEGNPAGVPREHIQKAQEQGFIKYVGQAQDVRPFIAQADAVVLPSYYREGIPRVLLEAMAMAKPIITTDSVGCREVCKEGQNGFLVRPRDPQSLADAMIKFLTLSEEERKAMGEEGRKMVLEEFDERIVIDKYLKLIESCLT